LLRLLSQDRELNLHIVIGFLRIDFFLCTINNLQLCIKAPESKLEFGVFFSDDVTVKDKYTPVFSLFLNLRKITEYTQNKLHLWHQVKPFSEAIMTHFQ
jgi:hypothetical protein